MSVDTGASSSANTRTHPSRLANSIASANDHLGLLRAEGRPRRSSDGVSAAAGLWFIGFTPAIEGTLRLQAIEARRIAQRLNARH